MPSFPMRRVRGIIFDVPEGAIGVFGYAGAHEVVEVEGDRAVRDGFVDVAFRAENGEKLAGERMLDLVEEPVVR